MTRSTFPLPRRARLAVLCAAVPLAAARPLAAQTADSALTAGRYAAEFTAFSYTGLGLLHFSSPTRAVVLDFSADMQHSSVGTLSADAETFSVRLGRRGYRPISPDVRRLVTGGLVASLSRSDMQSSVQTMYSAGLYGDIGAAWFLTPHLSLGATWGATLTYGHTSYSGVSTAPSVSNVRFTVGQFVVRGGLYF